MRDDRGSESGSWNELVARIVRILSGPAANGVLVAAERGMGKTTLMRQVLVELPEDVTWTRITTSSALGAIRYGALAPYLGSLGEGPLESDGTLLRSVQANLRAASSDESRPVVVVDDAHYLDTASAELLGQLVATNSVTLFALTNPGPALPRALRTLWMEGVLERIDLQPLTSGAAKMLCEGVLGGPIAPTSSLLLWKSSGGLPLALSALVDHNRSLGTLALRGGIWRLVDQPSLTDPGLIDLVRDRSRRVGPAAIELLELLSLAGPMTFLSVLEVGDASQLDLLEEEGLVAVGTGQEGMVSVANPLYAGLIRQLVPAGRSAALFNRTRQLRETAQGKETPEHTISFLEWALDCGAAVPQEELVAGARKANHGYQPHAALRIAAAVTASKYLIQARIQIAQANYLLGIPDAAELGRSLELAPDMVTATEAAVWEARFSQRLGQDPSQVQSIARRWALTARRITKEQTGRAGLSADDEVSIRSLELYGLNIAGRYAESEPELRELAHGYLGTLEDRHFTRVHLGEALGAQGQPRAGAAVLAEALRQVVSAAELPDRHQEFALLHGAVCSIFSAEWSELEGAIDDYLDRSSASLVYFGAVLELVEGFKELRRGSLARAEEYLASAVEGLQVFDNYQMRPLALGLAAYVASLAGDRDRTAGYLGRFDQRTYDGGRQLLLLGEGYAAAARAWLVPTSGADAELRRVRSAAAKANLVSVEMHALELSIRLGDDSVARRLADLSTNAEGTEALILHLYADALLSGQEKELIAAAEEAGRAGYSLLAVDAAARAIAILKASGSNAGLARAYQVFKTYHPHTANVELFEAHQQDDLPVLSERELRVAQLVAQGSGNRAVAGQLHVSLRTVEGHLYRVFKKIGISRRDELTPALVAIIEKDRQ
ncbi:LuxR C-terminal-related transcriptional regulator [Arthrobacter sp. TMT4-20]